MQRLTKFENLVCSQGTTIAQVLRRIESATPNVFQIVLSDDGRVLGTITDGDVRRAMLRGAVMSATVDTCMQTAPILGCSGEDAANLALFRRAWFLPVVDAAGRLDHILAQQRLTQPLNYALLMAGGFGRRLGDLTRGMPKPLLTVGGRPILDRILEQLEASGVSSVHIAVHYEAEQIKNFIAQRRNLAQITFIDEIEPLGTAGALARLAGKVDEPLLIVNGDVLSQVDLGAMCEFNSRHGYDGTIAVSRYEVQIPYGVIRQNAEGAFAAIEEKPQLNHFIAAGLYYLSPEFVALTPRGRPVDMPELLTLGASAGLRIGLFPVHEYWKDVGQPNDLAAAHRDHGGTVD